MLHFVHASRAWTQPKCCHFFRQKISQSWVLTAEFSLEKAQESVQEMHGDSVNVLAFSAVRMKQEIVAYLKKHVQISVNDSVQVVLGAGGIKMDGHHVEVILQLQNLPDTLDTFEVVADAFSEKCSQNNLFIWGSAKFVLNALNSFRMKSDNKNMKQITPEVVDSK